MQNFAGDTALTTLTGGAQTIPGGPVASQEAIKELGTNGGGFFNANSAHPFENPNGLTNLIEIFLILVIPFSLTRTFGRLVGDLRQGYAILAVMASLWAGVTALLVWAEVNHAGPALQLAGAAMEGKEVRFGVPMSAVFASSTTRTSTGAVNSMHSSFTAFGGGLALVNMVLGEVTPGGTGSGLYGILIVSIVAVFIAGLMVGRTPEYLGKKIGSREMKLVSLYILTTPALVLLGDGGGDGHGDGAVVDAESGGPRPVRGLLRVRVGVQQQRLRLRRPERQHRLLQRGTRRSRCSSVGSCRSASSSPWPDRWPSRTGRRRPREPCRPTGPSSSCSPSA